MTKAEYMKLAKSKGAECGRFVATLRNSVHDGRTIERAAVAFVNHLPLNDLSFEADLQATFETAAKLAALFRLFAERRGGQLDRSGRCPAQATPSQKLKPLRSADMRFLTCWRTR